VTRPGREEQDEGMGATLRIEIFPADLAVSLRFYEALGFEIIGRGEDPAYASIRKGEVRIGLLEAPARPPEHRQVPSGTEIVIVVDDVEAERDRALAAGLVLAEDLVERAWGLTDFRVHDPDGYYLRLTDRR